MESSFTHYPFVWEDDGALALAWTEFRRKRIICRSWLPETGFVIYHEGGPVMMLWLYFDPSCTIGFWDWVITKPGVSKLYVTKPAMEYAHREIIPGAMRDHGADTLILHAPRSIIRYVPEGWLVSSTPLVSMGFIYREEDE